MIVTSFVRHYMDKLCDNLFHKDPCKSEVCKNRFRKSMVQYLHLICKMQLCIHIFPTYSLCWHTQTGSISALFCFEVSILNWGHSGHWLIMTELCLAFHGLLVLLRWSWWMWSVIETHSQHKGITCTFSDSIIHWNMLDPEVFATFCAGVLHAFFSYWSYVVQSEF